SRRHTVPKSQRPHVPVLHVGHPNSFQWPIAGPPAPLAQVTFHALQIATNLTDILQIGDTAMTIPYLRFPSLILKNHRWPTLRKTVKCPHHDQRLQAAAPEKETSHARTQSGWKNCLEPAVLPEKRDGRRRRHNGRWPLDQQLFRLRRRRKERTPHSGRRGAAQVRSRSGNSGNRFLGAV